MLTKLELTNFRAFKSESFRFSNLNIFVGPNNSGKSSALSALNLLAQSISTTVFEGSPVTLNGQFDQLGTFKDMVHGGRSNTPVGLCFDIREFSYSIELKYRTQRREVEVSKLKLSADGASVYEYVSTRDRYDVMIGGRRVEELGGGIKKVKPRLNGFVPQFQEAFNYQRNARISNGVFSESVYEFLRNAERKINSFRRLVFDTFFNYDTLGAFREMPQRTYLVSGETAEKIGRNGQNTVTMLASDASKRGAEQLGLVEEISKWFRVTGIAAGVQVKYLTDRHFELVVIGKDGSDHNICDVGFGCSQVLPVLVAGISHASNGRKGRPDLLGPTLVIQEPEIHLHPNAQAALGSFFAHLARSSGQIFIETHSDSLVLRIARHIAAGDIPAESVRIFYVQDSDGLKKVTPIAVSSDGAFEPEWPGGFFPQRQMESFELARASLRKEQPSAQSTFSFIYPER